MQTYDENYFPSEFWRHLCPELWRVKFYTPCKVAASCQFHQDSILLTAVGEARISASFAPILLTPVLIEGTKRTERHLHTQAMVVLQERNPELRESKSLITGVPAFCSGQKHCIFQSCSLFKYAWKGSASKTEGSSLIRHSERQETHGKVSPCLPAPHTAPEHPPTSTQPLSVVYFTLGSPWIIF